MAWSISNQVSVSLVVWSDSPSVFFVAYLQEYTLYWSTRTTLTHHRKKRILDAALTHVPVHGWSLESLVQASQDCGYPPITHGLFPRGPIELVEYFVLSSTHHLKNKVATPEFEQLGTTGKIRTCVHARLDMLKPYISHWPRALAMMSLPLNAPNSVKNLAELMDEMWYLSGDRSIDFNWYSKRFLLTGKCCCDVFLLVKI